MPFTFTFTVTRDSTTEVANPLTVNLSVGGTATFGVDYTVSGAASFTSTTASVIIPGGATSATIVATVVPDAIVEPNETIILTTVPASGVSILGVNPAATATILNDDVGGDPLFASVVLLLPLTTASGLTDIKGKAITGTGTANSTAIADPFGGSSGVRIFNGSEWLSVASSTDFNFPINQEFSIEFFVYPTAFPTGNSWGLFDGRNPYTASGLYVSAGNNSSGGSPGVGNLILGAIPNTTLAPLSTPAILLNQWNYVCYSRDATGITKCWIRGTLSSTSAAQNIGIVQSGNLLIGKNNVDAIAGYNGKFTGYMSNLRISRAYRDGSTVPTAPFPTN
jgi:Concanavalin A-like lectin/glucanases superfamily